MSLSSIIKGLRRDAPQVAQGRFRIDSKRALRKLRDFRLVDPHHYVLELLRAAVASGASRVEVRNDSDDLEIEFDGTSFPEEVLSEIFGYALSGGGEPDAVRYRLLALGLVGAMGLKPRIIDVSSGEAGIRILPGERIEPYRCKVARAGTRVHVKERLSWRVLRDLARGPRESEVIREATPYFPAELTINGDRWLGAGSHPDILAERQVGPPSVRVVAAARSDLRSWRSTVVFGSQGVAICRRDLVLPALQVTAWANCDELSRDVSGAAVVEDRVYGVLCLQVARAAEQLIEDLMGRIEEVPVREALVRAAVTADIAGTGARLVAEPVAPLSDETRKRLEEAPLLPGPSGEWLSVADLSRELARGRPIRIAEQQHPAELYEPPVLRVDRLDPIREGLVPPGPKRKVDDEIRRNLEREERRRLFERLPREEPRLWKDDFRVRVPVEGGPLQGELGIRDREGAPTLRLLLDGRVIEHWEVERLSPLRIDAVVASTLFKPDDMWHGVVRDDAYELALEAVARVSEAALLNGLGEAEKDEAWCGHLRDLVAFLIKTGRRPIPALSEAPIYELAGGGRGSLDSLGTLLRYVEERWPHPPLDDTPVAVLGRRELAALEAGAAPLVPYEDHLRAELEVRKRMAEAGEQPVVGTALLRAPVKGVGLWGELGLLEDGPDGLRLRLLRNGFRLVEVARPARFPISAAVECAALTPTPGWDGAVEDRIFDRVMDAVEEAVRELASRGVERWGTTALGAMPSSARSLMLEIMRRARKDGEWAALAEQLRYAPILTTTQGVISLDQVVRVSQAAGRLWLAAGSEPPEAPEDMLVVMGGSEVAELLETETGLRPEAPWAEIQRQLIRRDFMRQPTYPGPEPEESGYGMKIRSGSFRGTVQHSPTRSAGLKVVVLLNGRILCRHVFATPIPVLAILEAQEDVVDTEHYRDLRPEGREELEELAESLALQLVTAALREKPEGPVADVLRDAVGASLESRLPELAEIPLFPMLDGSWLALRALAGPRVCYVTREIPGPVDGADLIVMASHPSVRRALRRFGWRQLDVTGRLQLGDVGLRQPVTVPGVVVWREPLEAEGMRGELGVVQYGGAALHLFRRGRPLVKIPADLPPDVAAAVDCDALVMAGQPPTLQRGKALKSVEREVAASLERMARQTAGQWDELDSAQRHALTAPLERIGAWLLSRGETSHPCLNLRVLRTTDGGDTSFSELLDEQRQHGHVWFSHHPGKLLDTGRRVYRPRAHALDLLAGKRLHLEDVTTELRAVERMRRQPKLAAKAPVEAVIREPVVDPSARVAMEGEVALPAHPEGVLRIELLRNHWWVEALEQKHPVGAVARVNCDELEVNQAWTGVRRSSELRAVVRAVEAALENLLVRFLQEGERESLKAWLPQLLDWKLGEEGRLTGALLNLPWFADQGSRPVTVGRVLAAASEEGKVAVMGRHLGDVPGFEPDRLVLRCAASDRELLQRMKVSMEDLSSQARAHRATLSHPEPDTRASETVDETRARLLSSLEITPRRFDEALVGDLLDYFTRMGVRHPEQIDRLTGDDEKLARAPVFMSSDGRLVDLRTVASAARRQGRLIAASEQEARGEFDEELVLFANPAVAGWLDSLDRMLGEAVIEKFPASGRRAEPAGEEHSGVLRQAVVRLRREINVLTGLAGWDREPTVRAVRGAGACPVGYDRVRHEVQVDVSHAGACAALEQHAERPEGLFALLAVVLGVVQRARSEGREGDDGQATMALVRHLAANPELLARQ